MQVNEAQIERYPITTDLYHQMIERGILTENDKIELLEGELIKMSAVGPRHAACVERLSDYLKDEDRRYSICGFIFHNHFFFNQQVNFISFAERSTFIN